MPQDKDPKATPPGETGAEPATSAEQGRQPQENATSQAEISSDISHVDQQEGQMNHGETGGNFDVAGDKGNQP